MCGLIGSLQLLKPRFLYLENGENRSPGAWPRVDVLERKLLLVVRRQNTLAFFTPPGLWKGSPWCLSFQEVGTHITGDQCAPTGRNGGVRERGDSSKLFTDHGIMTGGNLEVKYSHVGIFPNEIPRLRQYK